MASHLGRPTKNNQSAFSLSAVGEKLAQLTNKEVLLVENYEQEPVDQVLRQLGKNQFVLLENLRFHEQEKSNDRVFAETLMKGMDFYISDAFGALHREHASVAAAPQVLSSHKKAVGYLIQKEVKALSSLKVGKHPFLVILGGAKVSDKIGVLLNMLNYCNHLVIGGAMAYTFLKFKGISTGASKVEEEQLELVRSIYDRAKQRNVNIILPVDHMCSSSFSEDEEAVYVDKTAIPDHLMGLDIGPKTIQNIAQVVAQSKTIFWNGPMGVFEWKKYSEGTFKVAKKIAASSSYSIVGGGDSVAAIKQAQLEDKFSHISTGGGASLEFIEGKKLPGLKVLENS